MTAINPNWKRLQPRQYLGPESDPDDGRYWPQIGGVVFDPRDVVARERLFLSRKGVDAADWWRREQRKFNAAEPYGDVT